MAAMCLRGVSPCAGIPPTGWAERRGCAWVPHERPRVLHAAHRAPAPPGPSYLRRSVHAEVFSSSAASCPLLRLLFSCMTHPPPRLLHPPPHRRLSSATPFASSSPSAASRATRPCAGRGRRTAYSPPTPRSPSPLSGALPKPFLPHLHLRVPLTDSGILHRLACASAPQRHPRLLLLRMLPAAKPRVLSPTLTSRFSSLSSILPSQGHFLAGAGADPQRVVPREPPAPRRRRRRLARLPRARPRAPGDAAGGGGGAVGDGSGEA